MTFDPGKLDPDTTYYWRIDAKNSSGTIVGEIWQFTTGAGGEALFFPIKSKDGNVVVIYLE